MNARRLLVFSLCIFAVTAFIVPDGLEESIKRGEEVYNEFCVTCHLADGKGIESLYPPLANSDYLLEDPERSIRALKFGLFDDIEVNGVTYNTAMPAMGLSDQEIADVMNYILNSWGNNGQFVSEEKVQLVEE